MSFTKVMGTIALEENDTRSIEDLVLLANSYVKAGAELLEIGAKAGANGINETRVISVLCAVMNSVDVRVARSSNNYEIVSQAIKAGVSMVITTNGLSTEGMIDLVKKSEVAVCLHFDPKKKIEDDSDVVSVISELDKENLLFKDYSEQIFAGGSVRTNVIEDMTYKNGIFYFNFEDNLS